MHVDPSNTKCGSLAVQNKRASITEKHLKRGGENKSVEPFFHPSLHPSIQLPIFALTYLFMIKTGGLLLRCNGLFSFSSLQFKKLSIFFILLCKSSFHFCQSCQPGVYCLLQMEGQEAGGMPWQATELYIGQLFMALRICLGFPFNTHLPRRHKGPSAARESKSAFECRRRERGRWWGMQLAALQVCHPIL